MFESKVQHGNQAPVVNDNSGKTRLAPGRILHRHECDLVA
jgi:hypothetical protein